MSARYGPLPLWGWLLATLGGIALVASYHKVPAVRAIAGIPTTDSSGIIGPDATAPSETPLVLSETVGWLNPGLASVQATVATLPIAFNGQPILFPAIPTYPLTYDTQPVD